MNFVILLIFAILHWSGGNKSHIVFQIQKHRIEKDNLFKNSDSSPLPEEHKKEFKGLSYFPIDLQYRFQLTLHKYKEKKIIKIITSAGTERNALKYGYFKFSMAKQECRLQVYKLLHIQDKHPNLLFVPFLDNTSGKESYAGGRYIDLEENDSDIYILDFNMAYNPYCAYGKGYVCPIPPEENRLEVEIRAGEKNFTDSFH